MVKSLTNKAREHNNQLNPHETDNRKKIYLNRDYTEKLIQQRKALYEEKKYRESRGEKNLVYRKRRVVQDPRYRNRSEDRESRDYGRTHSDGRNKDYLDRQGGERNSRYPNQEWDSSKRYRPNDYSDNDRYRETDKSRGSWKNTETQRGREGRLDDYHKQGYRAPRDNHQYSSNQSLDRQSDERRYYRNNQDRQRGHGQNEKQNYNRKNDHRPYNHQNQDSSRHERKDVHKAYYEGKREGLTDYEEFRKQKEKYEKNRSPMHRLNTSSTTLHRDDIGPYLRDEGGREIRGAEAASSPSNENHNDWENDTFNDYDKGPHDREMNGRGRGEDYREYEERGARQKNDGRPVREASRMHNRHQPGSKPYGSAYGRR